MGNTLLILLFASASQTFNLPPGLINGLCFVESSHVTTVIHHNDGGSASIGTCQIKLATAKQFGFKGTEAELRTPAINIFYASKYLRHQCDRYHGDIIKAVAAYNAGSHRVNEQGLIKNRKYVKKVLIAWGEGR